MTDQEFKKKLAKLFHELSIEKDPFACVIISGDIDILVSEFRKQSCAELFNTLILLKNAVDLFSKGNTGEIEYFEREMKYAEEAIKNATKNG